MNLYTHHFKMFTIYNEIEFPCESLPLNKTFLNLALDCLELPDYQSLAEHFESQDPTWRFDIPLSKDVYSKELIECLISFSRHHSKYPYPKDFIAENLVKWDEQFMENVKKTLGDEAVYRLYELADFADNEQLIHVCSVWIAQYEIVGMSAEELRKKFNIKNDFTEEELKELQESLSWIENANTTPKSK